MKRKSLAQQISDTIYDMIIHGDEFQPGDRLPGENELSEQLDVSRSTLREAIRILVSQGILEVYRGKGTFIAADVKSFGDFGLEQLDRVNSRLKDLFEARLLFEPEMAALACRRATKEELDTIIDLGEQIEQVIRDGGDRTKLDQDFHRAIVAASHNDFMLRLIPIINNAISEAIRVNPIGEILAEVTLKDHSLLISFLEDRDASGAKQAMSIHIHHAIKMLNLNSVDDPIF